MGIEPLKRAVFLDRDGTLNEAVVRGGRPYPPQSAEEVRLAPHARSALDRLRAQGFLLIVVTNQPDVARGRQTREAVEAINTRVGSSLGLSDFRICWHDDQNDCDCRKPMPGLILDAARDRAIDLRASFVVGDRWRDVAAGHAAGCRTILIEFGYDEPCPVEPDVRVTSLSEAVDWILAQPSFDRTT
jgi:D-glycero-D-manno-heptose 1,7-bisphosphate phosphatase